MAGPIYNDATNRVEGYGGVAPQVDGATVNIDVSSGAYFSLTLGGNRAVNFVNPSIGQDVLLELTQDGTGSRTVTWANVRWAAGTAPTLTTTAAATDILQFTYNGTLGKWFGQVVGKAFA